MVAAVVHQPPEKAEVSPPALGRIYPASDVPRVGKGKYVSMRMVTACPEKKRFNMRLSARVLDE